MLSPLPAEHLDARMLVAFSGGLDSTALLHLLAKDTASRRNGLRALHVHHGLHPQADEWVAHCRRFCDALGIPLHVVRVEVARDGGQGPEAAARQARYAAILAALQPGEVLVTAHHRDDQAETFLLRALRASGPDGLAAMREWQAFAQGWHWRPLLRTPRSELLAHAKAHGLDWIEERFGATSYDTGLELGMSLLTRRDRPDGIFCTTDLMACGVLDAARWRLGLRIPEELSVIGFDGIPQAGWEGYDLTTFRQPIEEIAEKTVAWLSTPAAAPARQEVLSLTARLLVRNSVRRIPAPVG